MAIQKTVQSFVQSHDPADRSDYTFRFRLAQGETIVSADVYVVDQATDLPPVPATDLVLSNISFGLMPDQILWGVTVWVAGGTAVKRYYLQCKIVTNSTPIARNFVRTIPILCTEQ